MKHQHVRKIFCYLIFTLSMFFLPLTAIAAIERTEIVVYDLATASQRSYTVNMLPTSEGAHISLHRNDNKMTLSMEMAVCFNRQPPADPVGYLWLKKRENPYADPALSSFLNFSQENNLRVAMKSLSNTQTLLLDKDSLTVLVVEPAMMTLGTAGCQH